MTDEIIKPDFKKCVLKTTGHYYKLILVWGSAIVVVCAVVYGIILACTTFLPILATAAFSVPLWMYIPVGFIVIPALAAVVVCYVNLHKKEIQKIDDEFICPE